MVNKSSKIIIKIGQYTIDAGEYLEEYIPRGQDGRVGGYIRDDSWLIQVFTDDAA